MQSVFRVVVRCALVSVTRWHQQRYCTSFSAWCSRVEMQRVYLRPKAKICCSCLCGVIFWPNRAQEILFVKLWYIFFSCRELIVLWELCNLIVQHNSADFTPLLHPASCPSKHYSQMWCKLLRLFVFVSVDNSAHLFTAVPSELHMVPIKKTGNTQQYPPLRGYAI